MYNRLDSFLHKHRIFYKYQFRFRKNQATTNALTEEQLTYINHLIKEVKWLVSILTSKNGFDTVQHDILLSKI